MSSKTVEAAGLKLLGAIDRDGKPRDYYAHVDEPDETAQKGAGQPRALTPVG